MKIMYTDIEWDTDGDAEMKLALPDSVEVNLDDVDDFLDDDITEDNSTIIADYLSDQYGFCVETFDYKVLG